MTDEHKLLRDLYVICGGDITFGDNPHFMFGYVKETIEMLREKGSHNDCLRLPI